MFGLWEHDATGVRTLDPNTTDDQIGPECITSFGQCVAYSDPADIPANSMDLWADQKAECEALTVQQAKNHISGGPGYTLLAHWCRSGPQLNVTFEGKNYTYNLSPSPLDGCVGSWEYDGYCSPADCDDGSGTSTGGDSSGGTSGAVVDCVDWDASSFSFTEDPNNAMERTATVSGDAAAMLIAGPYEALYTCGKATINSSGAIWSLERTSRLNDLGLAEDDEIRSVGGETTMAGMMQRLELDIANGTSSKIEVYRPRRGMFSYTLVLAP